MQNKLVNSLKIPVKREIYIGGGEEISGPPAYKLPTADREAGRNSSLNGPQTQLNHALDFPADQ